MSGARNGSYSVEGARSVWFFIALFDWWFLMVTGTEMRASWLLTVTIVYCRLLTVTAGLPETVGNLPSGVGRCGVWWASKGRINLYLKLA